jgi:hypothetical protein
MARINNLISEGKNAPIDGKEKHRILKNLYINFCRLSILNYAVY